MASWGASSSKRSFVRPALFLTLFVLFLTVKLVRVQATRHNFQVRDEATEVLASARSVRRSGGEIVGRHLYEDDYDDEGEEDYDDGEFLEDGEYQDEDFVDEEEGGDFFALDGGDEEEYEENLDQEEQERGRGDKKEEEGEEEDEIDLGFDDDDDGEEEEEEEGEGQEEEEGEDFSGEDFYEEDFGDYYDDEDFEEDNGAGADEGEGEGERGREGEDEGVWGFEGGDESFTSFCEGEEGNKRTDIEACDVLVQGLDDNISKTHLHVDGVYKPESCMNGYLRYVPAEGEDARMIAFDVDFEEWGFYNGTEVANENLILHGAQFEARVPQEVEAWYCDVKVCETDTKNEHFWTPITTATVQCITEEEEEERVRMMGKRKNKVVFPDKEKRNRMDHSDEDDFENAPPSENAMTSVVVLLAMSIVLGLPMYFYVKQNKRPYERLSMQSPSRKTKVNVH